jgi:hypothetical protein
MLKTNKFQKFCIDNSIKGSFLNPLVYRQFKNLISLEVRIILTGNFFYDDILVLEKCLNPEIYSLFANSIEHYSGDKLLEYKI